MRGADIEHIALGPFPTTTSPPWWPPSWGRPDPTPVRRGRPATEQGNPFFTEQLVAAERDVERSAVRSTAVPSTVAHLLLARVRSVGPAAADAAAVLAVIARPLAEDELVSCLGDPVAVAAGLDELLEARLVEATEDGRYRLRHALLEDTVRATLLPSRRASLHAAVAAVLAARGGERGGRGRRPLGSGGRGHRGGDGGRSPPRGTPRACSPGARRPARGDGCGTCGTACPTAERPAVDLGDVVVSCVECLRRGDDEDLFAHTADLALADERLRDDDWSQARLLSAYAPYLGYSDRGRDIAARVRAAAHYERTGRPSGAQAANLFHARRHPAPREPPHGDRARGQGCALPASPRRPARSRPRSPSVPAWLWTG